VDKKIIMEKNLHGPRLVRITQIDHVIFIDFKIESFAWHLSCFDITEFTSSQKKEKNQRAENIASDP
jgi:hypothetical protein